MTPTPADFCPYVGLRPFTVAEQPFFFGRRSETRVVAANLFATPLTVFYGPSAVGKSSVLQAGVIPQLRREPRTAVLYFRDWQHDDYLDRLKNECRLAIEMASGTPLQIDRALPLDAWIDAALEQFRGQLHILLDQFEEYLLYHPDDSDTAFDGELAAAINRRDVGARFLIGLREDGLAKLDRFRKRIPNLLGNALRLRRLSIAAAREAIEGPVRVFNEQRAPGDADVQISTDLIDAVIEQVRADQVNTAASAGEGSVRNPHAAEEVETAYLQLVMERLWRERTPVNGHLVIQRAVLDVLGGAKAIAKRHFDEHLQRLAGQRTTVDDMVCDLFSHLVTPTGSKISQKEGDLVALTGVAGDDVSWFLRELVSARLLRVTDPPERYEIFHDALAKPFLDARNAIVLKRATLAREAELKRVQAMADAQQARAEAEAARAAEQRAAARRFKRLGVGATALAVGALVAAAFAWWSMQQAEAARQEAREAQGRAQRAEVALQGITERTSTLAAAQQALIDELTKQAATSMSLTDAQKQQQLVNDSKAELTQLNQQLVQVQRSGDEKPVSTSRDLETARTQVATLEARLKTVESQNRTLTTERDELKDAADRASTGLQYAQAEIAKLRAEIADLRARLAAGSAVAKPTPEPPVTTPKPSTDPPPAPVTTPPVEAPTASRPPAIADSVDASLPRGDYRTLYARGLIAFERREWQEAARHLSAAAQQKGDANENVRIYGMRGEQYLPNYYLGQTYRELGRCDDALRVWARSESQGIVQRNALAYRLLKQGVAVCQGRKDGSPRVQFERL